MDTEQGVERVSRVGGVQRGSLWEEAARISHERRSIRDHGRAGVLGSSRLCILGKGARRECPADSGRPGPQEYTSLEKFGAGSTPCPLQGVPGFASKKLLIFRGQPAEGRFLRLQASPGCHIRIMGDIFISWVPSGIDVNWVTSKKGDKHLRSPWGKGGSPLCSGGRGDGLEWQWGKVTHMSEGSVTGVRGVQIAMNVRGVTGVRGQSQV